MQSTITLEELIADAIDHDPSEITDDSSADTLSNWDSMNHVRVIINIEQAFNTRFSVSEVASFENVGDLRRCLNRKGIIV